MQELNLVEVNEVSGAGIMYDIGKFWGSAFRNGDWDYPMAGSGYALGA
ncbi:hypothetical protein H8K47_03075 [Undibacterium sp. CY7W]|uniref:Uncharacterized protein n=1 Tax=Undibacterium rugosum TaxID=2762291 RepID=A0A923HZS3_9BURK|nr:hypothetical protein [Undibacterium rugosum]MBC3934337.1 hypothetical protein [Undibacterium rugosum]